jgi:hypothetical protein
MSELVKFFSLSNPWSYAQVIFSTSFASQGSISSTFVAKSEWRKAQSCQLIAKD